MPFSRGRPPHHIGIDRRHRLIRRWAVTDAARHDGALLPELIDPGSTASEVWADTAYRSKANEKYVRMNRPIGPFSRAKTCSTPERTIDLRALARAVRCGIGLPFGFLRWICERSRRSAKPANLAHYSPDCQTAPGPHRIS